MSPRGLSGAEQSSSEIADGIIELTSPGSVILLHPWFGRTPLQEAIGEVIDRLHATPHLR